MRLIIYCLLNKLVRTTGLGLLEKHGTARFNLLRFEPYGVDYCPWAIKHLP
jgi:hypothetical protein